MVILFRDLRDSSLLLLSLLDFNDKFFYWLPTDGVLACECIIISLILWRTDSSVPTLNDLSYLSIPSSDDKLLILVEWYLSSKVSFLCVYFLLLCFTFFIWAKFFSISFWKLLVIPWWSCPLKVVSLSIVFECKC